MSYPDELHVQPVPSAGGTQTSPAAIWTDRPRSEGRGQLHYFEQGAGPTLVLIHGVGLKAEAWCAMLPLLSRSFHVIMADMPGHGTSPLNDTETLSDFVGRFSDFLSGFNGPVGLVGHSMGALLAIELAARDPEKVSGIVALNTVYQRSAAAAEAVQARANALSGDDVQDPADTLKRWFGENPKGPEGDCAEACRRWLTAGSMAGYAAAYRVFAGTAGPSTDTLARITCPAFYVTGALDPNSTPAMTQALASATTGGAAHVIAEAAHMMPMTQGDEVARLLTRFFETQHATHSQKGT